MTEPADDRGILAALEDLKETWDFESETLDHIGEELNNAFNRGHAEGRASLGVVAVGEPVDAGRSIVWEQKFRAETHINRFIGAGFCDQTTEPIGVKLPTIPRLSIEEARFLASALLEAARRAEAKGEE